MRAPLVLVGRQSRSKTRGYRTRHLREFRDRLAMERKEENARQNAVDRRIERANRRIDAALRGCS